jgi:hypothetical protein
MHDTIADGLASGDGRTLTSDVAARLSDRARSIGEPIGKRPQVVDSVLSGTRVGPD